MPSIFHSLILTELIGILTKRPLFSGSVRQKLKPNALQRKLALPYLNALRPPQCPLARTRTNVRQVPHVLLSQGSSLHGGSEKPSVLPPVAHKPHLLPLHPTRPHQKPSYHGSLAISLQRFVGRPQIHVGAQVPTPPLLVTIVQAARLRPDGGLALNAMALAATAHLLMGLHQET